MSLAFSILMAMPPRGLVPGWHPIPGACLERYRVSGAVNPDPPSALVLPSLMPLDRGKVIGVHDAMYVLDYLPSRREPEVMAIVGPINMAESHVTINEKTYQIACLRFVDGHWPGVRWYQPEASGSRRGAFEAGDILHGWHEGKCVAAVLTTESP